RIKLLKKQFSSFAANIEWPKIKYINEKTARLAGKLTALFPELIVYSAFLLKDTILTLLCTIIIFLIIYYNHYGRLGLPKILLLFTALIYISLIRFYMIAILGVILILFYIFTKKIPISRKILGLSLIIILVFLVMIFGRGLEFYENIYSGKIFLFGRYAESELSFTPVFGGAVGLISFVLEKPIIFIKTVLLGSIYAWAGPISWHTLCSPKWFGYIVHALKANYFAVLVWYVFAPFAFWGLYYLIKYRRKLFSSATLISSYLIIYPLIIAVKEKGGLRHRLPIIPFVLICVALAMIRYKKYRFPLFILGIFLMLAFLILDFFIHIPSITS
ncbi:hypothetical protein KKH26_02230, partial [Patescibacteria group bacterium]|nr:hypothetical protein [Patescibacteria group bacterium]